MAQLKDYSIPELIHLLGSRYRDYRGGQQSVSRDVSPAAEGSRMD